VRYQEKPWSCGPAALRSAGIVLGEKISERTIRAKAGTNEDGTDEQELIQAARELGWTATPHHSADTAAAWAFVRANVLDGRPCLLCIDQWTHWVCVIGIVGDKVIYFDPAKTKKNVSENGVTIASRTNLSKRWRCPSEAEPFYAIAIGK
jgi:ABC-type bacteriocin/lantibiotic exporter with double-glycine peptidase domain